MATKTQLTVTGADFQSTNVWVVATAADAAAVETAGGTAVLVELFNGTDILPITDWTAAKGTGNWSDFPLRSGDHTVMVYVAFPPILMVQAKVKNFINALQTDLAALAVPMKALELPGGTTLATIAGVGINAAQEEEYLLERIEEKVEEAADRKASQAPTLGETGADLVYDIAHADFNFHQSTDEQPFLTKKNSDEARIALTVAEAERHLRVRFLDQNKKVPASSDVKDALKLVEAKCSLTDPAELALRSVKSEATGNIWVDLGRKDGLAVCITKQGWTTTKNIDADVFFKRSSKIKELPLPVACPETNTFEALQAYRRFANIPDAQWALVVGWMVTHMIPGYRAPLAFFLGGAGSGKTTLSTMTHFAVEGIKEKGSDTGGNDEDLTVAMSSERVRILNNISDIPEELSELLCKVYDGVSITKRKRYTDNDTTTLSINCSVIANGITVGRMKEDLKTRVLAIDVNPEHGGTPWDGKPWGQETVAGADKLSIDDEMERAHPEVLGALFTLMSQVLRYAPDVYDAAKQFRLEEYATVLLVLDLVWSLNGGSVAEYKSLLDIHSEEALDDPLFEGIRQMVIKMENYDREQNAWVLKTDLGTMLTEFETNRWANMMERASGGHASFKTTNSLRDAIIRKGTDWKRLGVTYERHTKRENLPNGKKGTMITFKFQNSAEPSFSVMPVMKTEARF